MYVVFDVSADRRSRRPLACRSRERKALLVGARAAEGRRSGFSITWRATVVRSTSCAAQLGLEGLVVEARRVAVSARARRARTTGSRSSASARRTSSCTGWVEGNGGRKSLRRARGRDATWTDKLRAPRPGRQRSRRRARIRKLARAALAHSKCRRADRGGRAHARRRERATSCAPRSS